ncbi:hypothetical protein M1O20_03830 [Dehalococcoidia bacterium]|nr:hypothetical protein [Dehalococcoidia bacterium]
MPTCKVCGEEFSDQSELVSHTRLEHPKEKDEGFQSDELNFSPMASTLYDCLLKSLGKKKQNWVTQIIGVVEKSPQVMSDPNRLKGLLSRLSVPPEVTEMAILSLFGDSQIGMSHQSFVPGQQYMPGGYQSQSLRNDGSGITARELESALASQRREFESLLTSALERKAEREARDKEMAERIAEARSLGKLESEIARLSDRVASLQNENKQQATDPVILERLSGLQSKFDDLRREAEARERIEMELSPLRDEIASLKEQVRPSRPPTEGELKSQNLEVIANRVGLSLDRLTDIFQSIGVPVALSQMTSQLRQQGIPDQEIPSILQALMSQHLQSPKPKAPISGLQQKIDMARSKWVRNVPRPAAQTPEPAPQATEPESKWPGEMRYVEQPRERVP